MSGDLFGIPVIESDVLPLIPDHKTDARRIVRHGFHEAGYWAQSLGEVGPRPGEATHVLLIGHTVHASAAIVGRLRESGR